VPGRVIVVGSVNIDLVVAVEHLPEPGETVTGGRFSRHQGGKSGNQAVAAARLGAPTTFIGAVGSDAFGEDVRAALVADGVDVANLVALKGEATGLAFILVDAAGENSIAVAGGANAALTPALVEAGLRRVQPRAGDVVLVGHEIPTRTAVAALRVGRTAGATTIFNPAPATGLTREPLEAAEIVTPNRGELAVLSGTDEPADAAARALLASVPGIRAVLVSLGAVGARLVTRDVDADTLIAAAPVAVIDTVGAGDALNGALAAGLASGNDLDTAARRAVVAAGLAVTRAGAREGMPTVAELEARLARGTGA
jgi:ribokinase